MNAAEQNWNIFREKKLLKNKFLSAKTSKINTVFEIPVLLKEPNNIRCKGKKVIVTLEGGVILEET